MKNKTKAGIAIGGVISTALLAIYVTPKANDRMVNILQEDKGNKKAIAKRVLTEVLPLYIPAVASGATSIYCIQSSTKALTKENIALAGLYASSETAYKAYQKKAIEKMGEKWHDNITHEANAEIIKQNPSTIIVGTGKTLCYDKPSAQYFESDMQTIRSVENDINKACIDQQYESINSFRAALNMKILPTENGRGWTAGDGYLNIKYDAQLNENGEPVLVIDYDIFDIL